MCFLNGYFFLLHIFLILKYLSLKIWIPLCYILSGTQLSWSYTLEFGLSTSSLSWNHFLIVIHERYWYIKYIGNVRYKMHSCMD